MRKLYNYLLFFTFVFVFSAFAAEEIPTITTVKAKTSQMSEVIRILEENGVNLKETAFYIDFDETLARTVGVYKDHEFKFLPCPDRIRTYKKIFCAGFQNTPYNLDTFNFSSPSFSFSESSDMHAHERYEVLDEGATDLICRLCEDAYFAGVCSALPKNELKNNLMEYVGLDKESYIYADQGKPQAICKNLEEITLPHKKITTVILMDNSEEFGIDPFLKQMPVLVKKLGLSILKIIGIEFTRFAEIVTEEAIRQELTLLDTLRKEGS